MLTKPKKTEMERTIKFSYLKLIVMMSMAEFGSIRDWQMCRIMVDPRA